MPARVNGIVRVALIGCGGIAKDHAKGYLKYKDKIKVTALVDPSAQRLSTLSDFLGGVSTQFADWKDAIAKAGDQFDAVDICLPHDLHARCILDASAAGKHVLCEKPMCMNLAEADQIAASVAKSGVTYMSSHNQLFMPAVAEARRIIDNGDIGRVFLVRSQDCFVAGWTGGKRDNWGWRADIKRQGGGELIDTGYHPTYRLMYLANSTPAAVRATMGRFYNHIDGEDTASVSVRFKNGVIGEILTSWAMPHPHGVYQVHVIGEKGQVFGSTDHCYFMPHGFSEPAKRSFAPVDHIAESVGHFADCLQQGKRPLHSVEEGRAVLEIILQATQSAAGWQETAFIKD